MNDQTTGYETEAVSGGLPDEVANLVLEHLLEIRADIARMERKQDETITRLGRLEFGMVGVKRDVNHGAETDVRQQVSLDRIIERIAHIEHRLFDTLLLVDKLKEAGIPSEHAEAVVRAIGDAHSSLVTKIDLEPSLAPLRTDLAVLKWMTAALLAGVMSLVLKTFF